MVTIAVPRREHQSHEAEWLVILTVTAALVLGWLLRSAVVNQMNTATVGQMTVAYPTGWVVSRPPGALFDARDLNQGAFAPEIRVAEVAKSSLTPKSATAAKNWGLTDVASAWSLQRARGLLGYRVLDISPATVAGRPAVRVTYAYVSNGSETATNALPSVIEASDTIVPEGDQFAIMTASAPSNNFEAMKGTFQRILDAWRLPG